MTEDIVDRLNSGEGIGACLSGNSWYAAKAMKDGATEIRHLRDMLSECADALELEGWSRRIGNADQACPEQPAGRRLQERDAMSEDTVYVNWPDCAIDGCPNKCCLALDSIYCFPHTPGNKHVKHMKIDAANLTSLDFEDVDADA